jgi:2-oxo-4-hydroxy-4-carboxy--5-ureidoimidazoline (OHCU) decarboxylase
MPVAVPLSMAALNDLAADDVSVQMAPLFEGAAAFLGRLASARPFQNEDDLFERALAIALAMSESDQVELLDAHPRIGALPGSVSTSSFIEQGYDRDTADAGAEVERARVQAALDRLNAAYESRMGFRFVTFVAGRSRAEIVPELEARLTCSRPDELEAGLRAVIDIARDRWRSRS